MFMCNAVFMCNGVARAGKDWRGKTVFWYHRRQCGGVTSLHFRALLWVASWFTRWTGKFLFSGQTKAIRTKFYAFPCGFSMRRSRCSLLPQFPVFFRAMTAVRERKRPAWSSTSTGSLRGRTEATAIVIRKVLLRMHHRNLDIRAKPRRAKFIEKD